MDQLLEKLEKSISNRPMLPYAFSFMLFLIALLYTRLHQDIPVMEGHMFHLSAVAGQTINGTQYFVPLYKEQ